MLSSILTFFTSISDHFADLVRMVACLVISHVMLLEGLIWTNSTRKSYNIQVNGFCVVVQAVYKSSLEITLITGVYYIIIPSLNYVFVHFLDFPMNLLFVCNLSSSFSWVHFCSPLNKSTLRVDISAFALLAAYVTDLTLFIFVICLLVIIYTTFPVCTIFTQTTLISNSFVVYRFYVNIKIIL